MDNELLTAPEVASLYRVKTVTVYAAAKSGKLPHIVLWTGKKRPLLRFRRQDIEALIQERTVSATPTGR
jgi:predicted DNA-binding transcriptional regulator AlpA